MMIFEPTSHLHLSAHNPDIHFFIILILNSDQLKSRIQKKLDLILVPPPYT